MPNRHLHTVWDHGVTQAISEKCLTMQFKRFTERTSLTTHYLLTSKIPTDRILCSPHSSNMLNCPVSTLRNHVCAWKLDGSKKHDIATTETAYTKTTDTMSSSSTSTNTTKTGKKFLAKRIVRIEEQRHDEVLKMLYELRF